MDIVAITFIIIGILATILVIWVHISDSREKRSKKIN